MPYSTQLISFLKSCYPEDVSLHTLALHLNLSTTKVMTLISELKDLGYPIVYDNRSCQFDLPLINVESIKSHLDTRTIGHQLIFRDRTPSTNILALEDLDSFSHGDVLLTDYQTNGKGRMGRNWHSSLGKSIALSIILKPDIENKKAVLLTQLTAAALSKSLEPFADTSIKWPNDMIINHKKVAGILTESQFNGSSLEGIVIGTGINTNLDFDDTDEEVRMKATSLLNETHEVVDPNHLITSFISWFDELYTEWTLTGDSSPFIAICKEKSILLNREITVKNEELSRMARVTDINSDGELIVIYEDTGVEEALQTLDFSIRGRQSYI